MISARVQRIAPGVAPASWQLLHGVRSTSARVRPARAAAAPAHSSPAAPRALAHTSPAAEPALHSAIRQVLQQHGVRAVSPTESPALVQQGIATVAQALAADPTVSSFIRPGREQQAITSALELVGMVLPEEPFLISADAEAGCAALVLALPTATAPAWGRLMSTEGLGRVWTMLSGGRLDVLAGNGLKALEAADAKKSAFLKEHGGRCLYVLAIGTRPERQGQGLGGKVLRALADLSDRTQVPLYLEASNQRNSALYQRNGFQAIGTERVVEGKPDLTYMWRPPQPAASAAAAGTSASA